MAEENQADWLLLEYENREQLDLAVHSRDKRTLFYPAIGPMSENQTVNIQVTIENSNVLFPMAAKVVFVRQRPQGKDKPRGVGLQIVQQDSSRFERLCAYIDGVWQPGIRRAHRRYPVSIRASYYLPPKYHDATVTDISAGGLFLRSDGPLPEIGKGVLVRLHPSRLGRAIELECQVRWLDEVAGRRGAGLMCQGPPKGLARLRDLSDKIAARAKTEN